MKFIKNPAVWVILILVSAFIVFSMTTNLSIFRLSIVGTESCEQDRSCCENVGLNHVCFRNDVNKGGDKWKDMVLEQDKISEFVQHYPSSRFIVAGRNSIEYFAKGGIGRTKYQSNMVINGPALMGGGFSRARWTPTKVLLSGESWGTAHFLYEYELNSDANSYVMNGRFKCGQDTDCTGAKQAVFKWEIVDAQVASTTYRTNIDGSYCGIQQNIKDSATMYDKALDKNFLYVFYPCPQAYSLTSFNANYDIPANGYKDVIVIVTTTDHESEVSDWIESYSTKDLQIRNEYQSFINAFKKPITSDINQADTYYKHLYTFWYNLYPSDGADNFIGKEITTPNLEGYLGMWKSDAMLTMLEMMSAVDTNSITRDVVLNRIRDWLEVFKAKSKAYPIVQDIPGEIQKYQSAPHQQMGYFPLISWNLYKIDGNKQNMCGMLPYYRSEYEFWKSDAVNGWLLRGASGDATDKATSYAGTDFSAALAASALGMANMYNECGDSANAQLMLTEFNNIKTAFNTYMWKDSEGIYCNLDSTGNCAYKNNDGVSYAAGPGGNCMAIALGIADDAKTSIILNTLKTDFVKNGYGFTSIPTQHYCFDFAGNGKSGCLGGGTWDGPIWGWDSVQCIWALKQKVAKEGKTQFAADLNYLNSMYYNIAKLSPFAAESYYDLGPAAWGSRPYGYGTVYGIEPVTNFNPYGTLKTSFGAQTCTPTTEVCDGLDNDCNDVIDDGVKISCMNYTTCTTFESCNACIAMPAEICDDKDNDCDGNIDSGCACVTGRSKQCGSTDIGECSMGTQVCSGNQWQACQGNIEPTAEIKDSKDNDCDGSVDEGLDSQCSDTLNGDCITSWSKSKIINFILMLLQLLRAAISS